MPALKLEDLVVYTKGMENRRSSLDNCGKVELSSKRYPWKAMGEKCGFHRGKYC